jgi:ketosteroid isomerase-like protein
MSRENVEIVRSMYAAYAADDYQASLGAYSEDCVWDDTQYRPDGAVHLGREALTVLVVAWRAAWSEYELEVESLVDAADGRVAVVLREKVRGRGGGVEITNRYGQVFTVREGKIVHTMVYRDAATALEAVGVRE